jgi:hypothetical protein
MGVGVARCSPLHPVNIVRAIATAIFGIGTLNVEKAASGGKSSTVSTRSVAFDLLANTISTCVVLHDNRSIAHSHLFISPNRFALVR